MLNILLICLITVTMSSTFYVHYMFHGVHTAFVGLGKSFAENSIRDRPNNPLETRYYFSEQVIEEQLEKYFIKNLKKYGLGKKDFTITIIHEHIIYTIENNNESKKEEEQKKKEEDSKYWNTPDRGFNYNHVDNDKYHFVGPDCFIKSKMFKNKFNFTEGNEKLEPTYFKLIFKCKVVLDAMYTNSTVITLKKGALYNGK